LSKIEGCVVSETLIFPQKLMINTEPPSWSQAVENQIVAVTVYTDKAIVTRIGIIALTGREKELVIQALPGTLEPDSIRVSGRGTAEVQLLGVSSDRLYSTKQVSDGVAQLTEQIEQLEAEKRHLQAQIDALTLQSSFIVGLREKTEEPFSHSLARKNLSLSEILDFLNFLGSQYSEYAIASADCKSRLQELDKELDTLNLSLQTIQTPHPQESIVLRVALEVAEPGQFELEISYMVNLASWTPVYDLRVDKESRTVHLTYIAEVTQSTGEDWLGAALTLSTAKPGLGTLPPNLEPWYITTANAPTERRRQVVLPPAPSMRASMREGNDNWSEEETITEESFIAAESIHTEVAKPGGVVTFQLNSGTHIPSDGTPHKTTIFPPAHYPCTFNYVTVPRLVSFAYLQAQVKNSPEGATLLPGKANIFRDHIFVGTTQLENVTPGQEFKLNLGIEESLKIERDLVERQVDKKLISHQRRITYGYRLKLTNLLNEEVSLHLTEQLPISQTEQIKVRLIRSNPQIQLGEMGILEWTLIIQPQERLEVYYQFSIEHPPELTVAGLDI